MKLHYNNSPAELYKPHKFHSYRRYISACFEIRVSIKMHFYAFFVLKCTIVNLIKSYNNTFSKLYHYNHPLKLHLPYKFHWNRTGSFEDNVKFTIFFQSESVLNFKTSYKVIISNKLKSFHSTTMKLHHNNSPAELYKPHKFHSYRRYISVYFDIRVLIKIERLRSKIKHFLA